MRFEKEFCVTEDVRKHGKPFVAKLFWNSSTEKLDRAFFKFQEHQVKNKLTVAGLYFVEPGDIIEIRGNVSWKNDWRTYYLIEEDGNDRLLCKRYEGKKLYTVQKYLMGKLTREEMLKQLGK